MRSISTQWQTPIAIPTPSGRTTSPRMLRTLEVDALTSVVLNSILAPVGRLGWLPATAAAGIEGGIAGIGPNWGTNGAPAAKSDAGQEADINK